MTEAPRKKRRWVRWVLGLPLLLALALYLARDPLATKLATRELAKRGTTCEGLALNVGWTLQSVAIDEVTCRRAEGRVTELAFAEGATLELEGITPRRLRAPALRVELREGPERLEDAGLALFDEALARPPLTNALTALAGFAAQPDRVDLAIDRVELGREGHVLVASHVTARRTDEGLLFSLDELGPLATADSAVSPDADSGSGAGAQLRWSLRAITARATADVVDGRATLVVDAAIAGFGREESIGVSVRGRDLRAQPDVTLTLDGSPAVRALRARAHRLRDRLLHRLR
jgi:hypothetical protein